MVVTSCKCGILPIWMGRLLNNEAAKMGRAAFLAPEISTHRFSCSLYQPRQLSHLFLLLSQTACRVESWSYG